MDLSGINGEIRPGIVHRLDKDTSGIVIIAKTSVVQHAFDKSIYTSINLTMLSLRENFPLYL